MATFAVPKIPFGSAPTREAELVRFVGSLCAATSLEQLERRFLAGFVRFGPVLADALPGVLGETIDRINACDRLERERDDAIAALDRLTAVLEVQRERPGIAPRALAPLTRREAEVAVLIADGLADREIAERLFLSHHTVSQYVKRIYRKLEVGSRVNLTRLLLGVT
jgi:DNA-binding CsgD family transcriptional regulator